MYLQHGNAVRQPAKYHFHHFKTFAYFNMEQISLVYSML